MRVSVSKNFKIWRWIGFLFFRIKKSSADRLRISLPTDRVASRERFATSYRQPHENREGRTFHPVSIGRRESRPSSWRRWGAFSPICRIRQGRLVSPLLSSCSPCGPRPDERLARYAVTTPRVPLALCSTDPKQHVNRRPGQQPSGCLNSPELRGPERFPRRVKVKTEKRQQCSARRRRIGDGNVTGL